MSFQPPLISPILYSICPLILQLLLSLVTGSATSPRSMSSLSLDSGSTCSVGGAARELQGRCYRICMVSDCFYPDAGGVENHMITLAQCLILQGHKVIVVTRSRGDRVGVRWMTNGLKVYYAPLLCMPDVFSSGRVVLPTLFASAPLLRSIWIREQIEIVHGHQAFSVLCHEALLHARTMGLKTCFTDHSLFGFSDASSIHMNKVQISHFQLPALQPVTQSAGAGVYIV
jgi:hypothetical protein